jgi:DNA mismatch endonuclease, patch repair protein
VKSPFRNVTPVRRRMMSAIRSKNTKPEKLVRRTLFAWGLRYRVHLSSLPGKPDIVFTKRRIAIFVHGCFWHAHTDCERWNLPKTRSGYWREKLENNARRDRAHLALLRSMGWRTVVIWECEKPSTWMKRLRRVCSTEPKATPSTFRKK